MDDAIRDHRLALRIDDATWDELQRVAGQRGEAPAELVVYAVELFLERGGFVPAWAQRPLDARLARRRPARRATVAGD